MIPSRWARAAQAASLALLLSVFSMGVPIHGHAPHEGGRDHIGSPEHAHGLVLVQHEMRLERSAPPVFIAPTGQTAYLAPPPLVVDEDLPAPDERPRESRAPPDGRPRAPPL